MEFPRAERIRSTRQKRRFSLKKKNITHTQIISLGRIKQINEKRPKWTLTV